MQVDVFSYRARDLRQFTGMCRRITSQAAATRRRTRNWGDLSAVLVSVTHATAFAVQRRLNHNRDPDIADCRLTDEDVGCIGVPDAATPAETAGPGRPAQ